MAEIHYLISDASKQVDVEAHVLRYWEEELELAIPRNELGHRYYTDYHIRLFRQVKLLKEKGYQLKAIKAALPKAQREGEAEVSGDIMEEDVLAAFKDSELETGLKEAEAGGVEAILSGERMEQFQKVMNHIIGRAMEENSEKLSQDISYMVHDKLMKEMEYLLRVSDEREEERFKQLDEVIRSYQRDSQCRAEAAASFVPFPFFRLKKKKFGRSGKKL